MRLPSRGSTPWLIALSGIIALLVLAAVGLGAACGTTGGGLSLTYDPANEITGPEAAAVGMTLTKYMVAVRQGDVQAQRDLWTTNNQASAQREVDKYAKLDVNGVTFNNLHIQPTDWPDHVIIHFDQVLPARGKPTTRAGLLQNVEGSWLIKELR